ncbi:prepilin-type N-terminal cleavage/methylation domain-containing protein [Limosilactobacillus equigenerosi]|nr:prepilin-type N-terminal cleavage/methylation domain-containing protein [Limosilactobacillus equigenerosi]
MNDYQRQAFTLIECIVALMVAAVTCLLLTGVAKNYQG